MLNKSGDRNKKKKTCHSGLAKPVKRIYIPKSKKRPLPYNQGPGHTESNLEPEWEQVNEFIRIQTWTINMGCNVKSLSYCSKTKKKNSLDAFDPS